MRSNDYTKRRSHHIPMPIETILESVFGVFDGVPSRETRGDNVSKKASTVCYCVRYNIDPKHVSLVKRITYTFRSQI
jgi:hypothetical protein